MFVDIDNSHAVYCNAYLLILYVPWHGAASYSE